MTERNKATAPVMNPTDVEGMKDIPEDAVALLVWRKDLGPQPLTVVVTRASWDMNKKVLMDHGMQFNPERVYEFDSPTNLKGRKTIFHFQGVTSWAGNVFTGIIPSKAK